MEPLQTLTFQEDVTSNNGGNNNPDSRTAALPTTTAMTCPTPTAPRTCCCQDTTNHVSVCRGTSPSSPTPGLAWWRAVLPSQTRSVTSRVAGFLPDKPATFSQKNSQKWQKPFQISSVVSYSKNCQKLTG